MTRIGFQSVIRLSALCITAFVVCFPLFGQPDLSSVKETFVFAAKDGQTLRLDKYSPENVTGKSPCMVFLFGGGFKAGIRDNKGYFRYFDYFVKRGYTVVSIDYRLGLKGVKPKNMEETAGALIKAVNMAVEDLYDATAFILQHAAEWTVDPERIVISGSSAGAVTVLQAEYERCNQTKIASRLPAGFRYAGVVGFAGAVLSLESDLAFKTKPAPILMFHGDADDTVPFGKIGVGGMCFCGSDHIASRLHDLGSPYGLFQFVGSTHKISESPMSKNLPEILRFLDTAVFSGQPLMLRVTVEEIGTEKPAQLLTPEDFIKKNFK